MQDPIFPYPLGAVCLLKSGSTRCLPPRHSSANSASDVSLLPCFSLCEHPKKRSKGRQSLLLLLRAGTQASGPTRHMLTLKTAVVFAVCALRDPGALWIDPTRFSCCCSAVSQRVTGQPPFARSGCLSDLFYRTKQGQPCLPSASSQPPSPTACAR